MVVVFGFLLSVDTFRWRCGLLTHTYICAVETTISGENFKLRKNACELISLLNLSSNHTQFYYESIKYKFDLAIISQYLSKVFLNNKSVKPFTQESEPFHLNTEIQYVCTFSYASTYAKGSAPCRAIKMFHWIVFIP